MTTATLAGVDQLVATANLKPDLPGLVHGIVSLDPVQVQCDGCGHIHEGERIGRTVIESGIIFGGPESDDRRLCLDCRLKAGWRLRWRDAR